MLMQTNCNEFLDHLSVPFLSSIPRILVYPYGVPGAVNVTRGDLARLDPEALLNDTLIEFGLK
jgi:hypothetical protein